jgi:hypothetical protein
LLPNGFSRVHESVNMVAENTVDPRLQQRSNHSNMLCIPAKALAPESMKERNQTC